MTEPAPPDPRGRPGWFGSLGKLVLAGLPFLVLLLLGFLEWCR